MKPIRTLLTLILTSTACLGGSLTPQHQTPLNYADSPASFEVNHGQADAAVQFLAHGQRGNLMLMQNETWLTIQGNGTEPGSPCTLRLKFAGANPKPKLEGLDPLPGKANYFFGQNTDQWHIDVPTFARVKYHDVYPGVDLVYYGNQRNLEYDFIVQPGGKPEGILLDFEGVDTLSLDENGDLLLYVGGNQIRQHKPVVYQEINGKRKLLSGAYVLHSRMQVGFQVSDYNRTKALIIDPVLGYSVTFGGSNLNQGLGVAVDAQNNVYVTGITTSRDFPTTNPYQTNMLGSRSAFIVKFNASGAVVYSTYLGGGLTNDITITASSGQGIAVDGSGEAFVTGYTTATNFPVKNAFQSAKGIANLSSRNAFVTELNSNGNGLVYSTYLGGNGNDTATGIALDTNGSAVITGFATSTNFPTFHAAQPVYGGNGDGFVAKLNTNGTTLIYSTYLGGSSFDNEDLTSTATPIGAVAVDIHGNAYVTGSTYSTNFPMLNAFQPTNATSFYGSYYAAFVTKLDPAGNLVYSTYFGGRLSDAGRAIGVDTNGNAYFAGNSVNGDLPTIHAFQPTFGGSGGTQTGDGFIAELDATGTNLIYCTYLGGSGDDEITGIAVRPDDGSVAVTGYTESPNFPLLSAIQPTGYQGLLKSVDSANTWTLRNAGLASSVIYSIQIDPTSPTTVYALTKNGCFKSMDGGSTWAAANTGLSFVSPSGSGASLLAIDPLHPNTLYAGCSSGVFKSTNGAATWASTSTGLPGFPSILSLALDPTAPTNLYVGTFFNGIYKSSNAGATWTVATNGLNVQEIQALAVDPNNSSNIFAGAGGFTFSASIYRSTNSGASWNVLGGGLPGGVVNQITTGSSNLYAVVGDSLGFPAGSNPSLVISTNGGVTWRSLLLGSALNFTALAVAPPATPTLTITTSGNNDNLAWPISFNGYILQYTATLDPIEWKTVMQTLVTNNGNYVMAVAMSGGQGYYRLLLTNSATALPPTLYLGTDQASGVGTIKSTDGGVNWSVVGPPGDAISALAVDPTKSSVVYSGLSIGRDAFLSTFTNGQLYASTYLGGSGGDQGNAVAIMNTTNLVLVGSTQSLDYPTNATTGVAHLAHVQSKATPHFGPITISLTPGPFGAELMSFCFDFLPPFGQFP